eukprot:CAMPEP_0116004320 /NCGR_PEP_ID=MMETSP0321-20121206/536_1 /TAXON_ID=163516 /ORGANISM="Leptocylindrus danicus var. danicus, Strain B650" /LENGTH=1060 /DNA_ID=CAMNT_0003472607 /DNA_START=5790 /DNA_END=8973 /DNA_ORIENTATION=-
MTNTNNNNNNSKHIIKPDSICIGSGRFLRSVLVPALNAAQLHPTIVQTRGTSFGNYIQNRSEHNNNNKNTNNDIKYYEVDTVQYDGTTSTEEVACYGCSNVWSLGKDEDKAQVLQELIPTMMEYCNVIGVGVTEAGLSKGSKAMMDLTDVLYACHCNKVKCSNPHGRICVINTDNVPQNGSTIQSFVMHHAVSSSCYNREDASSSSSSSFVDFLRDKVVFHNTMVDRITSQREGSNGMVPLCEPVPAKALVIEDLNGDLPTALSLLSQTLDDKDGHFGVVVRKEKGQLNSDIALKLRVANGTHTAVAHVMALCSLLLTDVLSSEQGAGPLLMKYLDAFFDGQILVAGKLRFVADVQAVYDDWRKRLRHPSFGLSSFFITQNGAAKGGIRIAPTVRDLFMNGQDASVTTAFAFAAILRFLTPATPVGAAENGCYRGWLDGSSRSSGCTKTKTTLGEGESQDVVYADGMRYNLDEGWYEFKCTCQVQLSLLSPSSGRRTCITLCDALGEMATARQPADYVDVIVAYLTSKDGGDMQDLYDNAATKSSFLTLARAVATLYARMVAGDKMLSLLNEMESKSGVYGNMGFLESCSVLVDGGRTDAEYLSIASTVSAEVAAASVIDLHTHLLPPSHGMLCLWGIDELLTYHYLVAEFFMTAPSSISPQSFYALEKKEQANLIWQALFVDRSPISEACRGVVTTLSALGLGAALTKRDLDEVRKYYQVFRDGGLEGAEKFSELVYRLSGVQYAVMTNIPFNAAEARHWRPKKKEYPLQYRSALRVDPLLAGDRSTIEAALKSSGYEATLDGARQYFLDWCDTMSPEYLMASTPHDFFVPDGDLAGVKKTGVDSNALKEPFAFVDASGAECNACEEGDVPSVIDEDSDFLTLLMEVCEERDLPLAIKIGAHRGVNPDLQQAGDGVVAFADSQMLARLCTRFPKVRFLATFLSRNNQHEACVLASKFRNLHIYGCWWFCNNPSIIKEISTMRVEMLGTSFTAQHSDARVLDQLIYKWSHSRSVICSVLIKEYTKLQASGWLANRMEIRRDIRRLFGGSYCEFMSKSFKV